jgi:hypothetical protein
MRPAVERGAGLVELAGAVALAAGLGVGAGGAGGKHRRHLRGPYPGHRAAGRLQQRERFLGLAGGIALHGGEDSA